MRTGSRLGVYGLGVLAVFGLAAAVGAAFGPIDVGAAPGHSSMAGVDGADSGLPPQASTALVDDFTVTLSGTPQLGESTLTFTVSRDGASIDTDPYFDAAGHLVIIRTSDFAYLHVHPLDNDKPGPVSFVADFSAPGTYRLYFDFSVDGAVRTAPFTVDVTASAGSPISVPDHETDHS